MQSLVIAGDITDAKDYHSATLVNKVVDSIMMLKARVPEIYILMGNHDFFKGGHPYFQFLNHIPGLHYISKPFEACLDDGPGAIFLPYTKTPMADWKGMDFSHFDYLFMHQTAPGSVASNGQKMDGEELPSLKGPKVYSGDIHVPQVIGNIEYIGSPYHVHFGDRFKPRCVLLDRRNRPVDLHFETISRITVTVSSAAELTHLDLKKGDQVKLRVKLTPEEKQDWHFIKPAAIFNLRSKGVIVQDVELVMERSTRRLISRSATPGAVKLESEADTVLRYVLAEELGADVLDMGLELI